MSKRLIKPPSDHGNTHSKWREVLPIISQLIPFLFADECGQLRTCCRDLASVSMMKNLCPTPTTFVLRATDLSVWPTAEVTNLKYTVCDKGHAHIGFSTKYAFQEFYFDEGYCCMLFTNHSQNGCDVAWNQCPTYKQIGTRSISPLISLLFRNFFGKGLFPRFPPCHQFGPQPVKYFYGE